jgi:thioredoxin-related protein
MKQLFLSLIFLFSLSCSAQKKEVNAAKNKSGDLVGIANKQSFLQEPYKEWFDYGYDDYSPDEAIVAQLKPLLKKVTIKTFMGTWCGDSQEQIPIFYKILSSADFKHNNLEMVTVNRKKKTPTNLQEGFDVQRVPTMIFFNKKGKEIGRIVEYPRESIEADMLKILSGKDYKHSYEN